MLQGAAELMGNANSLSEVKRELLEKYVRGKVPQLLTAARTVTRRPPGAPTPLSLVQEQIWRHAQTSGAVPSLYNESITIHRTGELDVATFERSFTEIIRRHEAWRTTFATVEGRPIQVIHPAPSRVDVPFVDLRGFPRGARQSEALRLAVENARRPFDLKYGPLVRPLLVTLDERSHRLFLTMHQSIVDGVSVYKIFPSELAAIYAAFSAGRPSPLPDLPLQYSDFAYWERQFLRGPVLTGQVDYWRERLAGELPQLKWPNRSSRPLTESFNGAIRAFTLPNNLLEELKEVSRREGLTLFMTLLAGFTILLFRYSEQSDVMVGTVGLGGRKRLEVQQLLGYFLNPVALRVNFSGNPTVREVLRQCREVAFEALAYDDVPVEYLMQELNLKPHLGSHSLFPMVITLAPPVANFDSGWNQTPMDVDSGWAKWDLYLELSERPTGLIGRVQYRTDVFRSAAISRFLQDFAAVLQALAAGPGQRVSNLPRRAYVRRHYPE